MEPTRSADSAVLELEAHGRLRVTAIFDPPISSDVGIRFTIETLPPTHMPVVFMYPK